MLSTIYIERIFVNNNYSTMYFLGLRTNCVACIIVQKESFDNLIQWMEGDVRGKIGKLKKGMVTRLLKG